MKTISMDTMSIHASAIRVSLKIEMATLAYGFHGEREYVKSQIKDLAEAYAIMWGIEPHNNPRLMEAQLFNKLRVACSAYFEEYSVEEIELMNQFFNSYDHKYGRRCLLSYAARELLVIVDDYVHRPSQFKLYPTRKGL